MIQKKSVMAAIVLAAMLLAMPVSAFADTTPLVPGAQAQQGTGEVLKPFDEQHSYRGVSASKNWLYQARVGGVWLNLRVYTQDGEHLTFQERCTRASTSELDIRLNIMASSDAPVLVMQLDQGAVDTLMRLGVTEIVVADIGSKVRMRYLVEDLDAVRSALGLGDKELLCVTGENDPVTIVSEDGVRRQASM